jgi:hypothetical protein
MYYSDDLLEEEILLNAAIAPSAHVLKRGL